MPINVVPMDKAIHKVSEAIAVCEETLDRALPEAIRGTSRWSRVTCMDCLKTKPKPKQKRKHIRKDHAP